MQKPVSDLLRRKGAIVYVTPEATVRDAVDLMVEHNTGSVLVLDEGTDLVGIFTERDLMRRVVDPGLASDDTPITEVMTADVIVVSGDTKRGEALRLMEDEHIRHLPVADPDELYGVISLRDLLRFDRNDKEFEVEQMRDFVMRKPYPAYPA
jgi:CBS domain-containing protein